MSVSDSDHKDIPKKKAHITRQFQCKQFYYSEMKHFATKKPKPQSNHMIAFFRLNKMHTTLENRQPIAQNTIILPTSRLLYSLGNSKNSDT